MRWNDARQPFRSVLLALLLALIAISCSHISTFAGNAGRDSVDRGDAHMNKWEFDDAIAEYTEAIGLDPDNASAYVRRAVAFYRKGDKDRAIADNTEAIRLDPKSAVAYRNRGREYNDKNDPNRAIADFTEALRLEPQQAEARCERARAFSAKREFDKAIADCTETIRLHPKLASLAFQNRGRAYLGKKAAADDRRAHDLSK
jgi:tetratricopeptide (TPR) repeat protein